VCVSCVFVCVVEKGPGGGLLQSEGAGVVTDFETALVSCVIVSSSSFRACAVEVRVPRTKCDSFRRVGGPAAELYPFCKYFRPVLSLGLLADCYVRDMFRFCRRRTSVKGVEKELLGKGRYLILSGCASLQKLRKWYEVSRNQGRLFGESGSWEMLRAQVKSTA